MKFSELESFMNKRGFNSLADIARALNATPQAVSNWKGRDHVPKHIILKVKNLIDDDKNNDYSITKRKIPALIKEDELNFSDILLVLAEQFKVIIMTCFVSVFITFTYVQFVQLPVYSSWAKILLPVNKMGGGISGLSGIASQFGVNMGNSIQTDLSSPNLYPELFKSNTFAKKILEKEFILEKYGEKLALLSILTHGNQPPNFGKDTLVGMATSTLFNEILEFNEDPNTSISTLKVSTSEPAFSKELAETVLLELQALNKFFKSQSVSEKINFIENRISSVKNDLTYSEQGLKIFNEKNRQISSPSLELEQERLNRDVEVQRGIYLTLKQQLELAKIEEVQETSVVQVLDKPSKPLYPSNKNIKLSVFLSGILGLGFGILFGFLRSYTNNISDIQERKKLRRVRSFLKKKSKDILLDYRVSAIVSLLLIIGLPYYLGTQSTDPVFFGMYSNKLMLLNIVYIIVLISSVSLFIYTKRNQN
jgi:uncharacterized protein involved in exopolysaccharide biosynthesis